MPLHGLRLLEPRFAHLLWHAMVHAVFSTNTVIKLINKRL